jgi:hypothetical protein
MMKKFFAYGLALLLVASPAWADAPTDAPATPPASGNTPMTQTSLLKEIMNLSNSNQTNTSAVSTATGTTADAAYVNGNGTIIALLKGIFGKVAGTLTTSDLADGPVTPGTVAGKSMLMGGQYNTAAPAPTNGQQVALQMDANGNAKVIGGVAQGSTTAGQLVALIACAVLTSPPTYTTAQTSPAVCDTSGNVLTKDSNGGTIATNTGNTATAAGAIGDSAYVSGNGSIIAVLKGIFGKIPALGQATMANSLPVALASNQTAIPVNPAAAATGGCTPGHFLTAVSNNSTNLKATGGTLCSLIVVQGTTTLGDVRLYDIATSAPTCSSATGVVANYELQSNATSPGIAPPMGPFGMNFANGIGICLTGAVADNDNTNFVTGVQVNYSLK